MRNLYLTARGAIKMNDNNEPVYESSSRCAIDSVYLINEPTHVIYNTSKKRIELDAQKGDILIKFYDSTFETPIVIVDNKEWADNIIKYNEEEQRRAERWAAEKVANEKESTKFNSDIQ